MNNNVEEEVAALKSIADFHRLKYEVKEDTDTDEIQFYMWGPKVNQYSILVVEPGSTVCFSTKYPLLKSKNQMFRGTCKLSNLSGIDLVDGIAEINCYQSVTGVDFEYIPKSLSQKVIYDLRKRRDEINAGPQATVYANTVTTRYVSVNMDTQGFYWGTNTSSSTT